MSLTPEQLNEINRISREITQLREQEAQYANNTTAAGQQQLQIIRNQLTTLRQQRDTQSEQLRTAQNYAKEIATFGKSYAKLSSNVKAQLQTQTDINNQTSVYKKLGDDIALSKLRESALTGDELAMEQERGALMSEINASLLTQAKATAKALDDAAGLTEFDKMRRDLKETLIDLSDEERKRLEDAIDKQETLYKKEQRINAIKESQKELYDSMPDSIKGAVDFAKKLGDTMKNAGAAAVGFVLLASIVAATLKSFTALDEAAKDFRNTTGITNSQMEGIKSDANEIVGQFGYMGVEAKGVFDTVAALKSEFSDVNNFSKDTVAALTLMNTNFGISAENAAKVQGIFEQVGGLSEETAASVGMQVTNMAKLAGVAPSKVFADIAENAEIASTLFKGDVNALAKSAIEARRLGTNLKSVADTAQKLLDFESGIEEELVAATFVGGQFNLSRARALAFEGKIVDAQKEILSQVQRTGNFRQKDYFTQQQLAKAAGMSVEEINKQLNIQDRLSKLSKEERERAEKAIDQGLDISQIKEGELETQIKAFSVQQEQQATLEQLQNAFMGIASTVGSILVPLLESIVPIAALIAKPFQWMADGLSIITDNFAVMAGFLSTMAIYSGIIYGNKIRTFALTTKQAIQEKIAAGFTLRGAIAGIFASLAKIPFGIGLIGAAAAVAGLIGLISKAGDVISPADGKTRISTKEGGLFELSPNDDLIAAPGIASAMSRGGTSTDGGNIELNLSQLSAPLNAVVNEIKALRADMANGKIAVYMDTEKVTSKIGRQVDISTRNNFNLGQA